ncbi:hypothetical protein [Inquilinus sp. OTU3971]|uniref:hypothetical protein n=1 Tax=Inquilinus sp. OTU3971 TaxID=3043855 RepID=UPI00313D5745
MAKIDRAKALHCVETITGQNLTGTLSLAEDGIRVELYSFSKLFRIEAARPIYLIAQTGQVVSLHSNVGNGLGTNYHYDRPVYHQGFISNVAIVGHDRWVDTDKVKRVTFTAKHAMELLRHKAKIEALGKSESRKEEDFIIFEDKIDGVTFKAWYGGVFGFDFDVPKDL